MAILLAEKKNIQFDQISFIAGLNGLGLLLKMIPSLKLTTSLHLNHVMVARIIFSSQKLPCSCYVGFRPVGVGV